MHTLPSRLSEPLPKLNWTKEGKSWIGYRWDETSILRALQGGGWFSDRIDYGFKSRDAANFAFASTKVYDTLREQHAPSA